jgi:sugar transferase (PEP-CTERM/EpsH1 system associated)
MQASELSSAAKPAPLVAHIIYRLGVGGLENGLVNLINHMPETAYRHAIICLKDSTDFQQRIQRADVEVYSIHKREGQDWGSLFRVYRLLRQLRPAIVHSRNLAAIEYQLVAWLAGVQRRVHGEHGWEIFDPDGSNVKYQWLRRMLSPLIDRFIPLSKQLQSYLTDQVGVKPEKITRICNGVDTARFFPLEGAKKSVPGCPFTFALPDIVIGTVGRMHGVKDQMTLVKAFVQICQRNEALKQRLKLILIGDGPLRQEAIALLGAHQLKENSWLPGEQTDIPAIMRLFDIFVLPSQAEGISNTILEAMATALPVIATDVGGNPELVQADKTGQLTPAGDFEALAKRLLTYINHAEVMKEHAAQGYHRALSEFSLSAMVERYQSVYDSLIQQD